MIFVFEHILAATGFAPGTHGVSSGGTTSVDFIHIHSVQLLISVQEEKR
jgi:hypothetical protein